LGYPADNIGNLRQEIEHIRSFFLRRVPYDQHLTTIWCTRITSEQLVKAYFGCVEWGNQKYFEKMWTAEEAQKINYERESMARIGAKNKQ
jgi:hypothetical protein